MLRKVVKTEPSEARPCIVARVSTDEQADGFSIDEQIDICRAECRQRLGVEVPDSAIFPEEGVSGGKLRLSDRPGLKAAIKGCVDGTYTHLVVQKLDRLSRNILLGLDALQTLREHHVTFISVSDRIDTSTIGNELTIQILLAVAEWVRKNISEEVKKGQRGRRKQGLHHGRWPFGAMPDPVTGALIPDERPIIVTTREGLTQQTTNYAGLLELFTYIARGFALPAVADALNASGYRTDGRMGVDLFERRAVSHIAHNRTYIGEISDAQGGWIPGKHQPLIPIDLWEAAQAELRKRAARPLSMPRRSHVHALGGGILRCASCLAAGHPVAYHIKELQRSPRQHVSLACYNRMQRRGCQEPTVNGGYLEEQITRMLSLLALSEEDQQRLIRLHVESQGGVRPDSVSRRKALDARFARVKRMYSLGDLTDAQYDVERSEIQAAYSVLDREEASHGVTVDQLSIMLEYARDLSRLWKDADESERQRLLNMLFDGLYVHNRRIVAYQPTARFWPLFQSLINGDTGRIA
jgi:DNA invertase Pin-like site-specific DNA recombinase